MGAKIRVLRYMINREKSSTIRESNQVSGVRKAHCA